MPHADRPRPLHPALLCNRLHARLQACYSQRWAGSGSGILQLCLVLGVECQRGLAHVCCGLQVSSNPKHREDCVRGAKFLAKLLESLGADVKVVRCVGSRGVVGWCRVVQGGAAQCRGLKACFRQKVVPEVVQCVEKVPGNRWFQVVCRCNEQEAISGLARCSCLAEGDDHTKLSSSRHPEWPSCLWYQAHSFPMVSGA